MNILTGRWSLGEFVKVPHYTETIGKKDGKKYKHLWERRYICVREATEGQQGILIKVLDRATSVQLQLMGGEPFYRDGKVVNKDRRNYYGFQFPKLEELKVVLDLLKQNELVTMKLREKWSHFDLTGLFWIRELKSRFFGFQKKPQYYDNKTKQVAVGKGGNKRIQRISIIYFE